MPHWWEATVWERDEQSCQGGWRVGDAKSLKAGLAFPSLLVSLRGCLFPLKRESLCCSQTAVTATLYTWSPLSLGAAAHTSLALQVVGSRIVVLHPAVCYLMLVSALLGPLTHVSSPLVQACLGIEDFVEIHWSLFTECTTNIIKLNVNAFEMQIQAWAFHCFALLRHTR